MANVHFYFPLFDHFYIDIYKWAEKFGQEEIDGMVQRARNSFDNYDYFRLNIPKWYTTEYRRKYGIQKEK